MRTLLVPMTGANAQKDVLQAGFRIATDFRAHLTGLFIRPDPRAAIPFMGEGLTADAIQDLVNASDREGQARADQCRADFEAARTAAGVAEGDGIDSGEASACFEETVGFVADRVGRAARLADLSIVPQPVAPHPEDSAELLNEVLFRSGRPLLQIPPGELSGIGEHVMVGWNGRAECARAVAAALPFLRRARKTTLLHIGDEHPDRPDLDALTTYLLRHGIKASRERREEGSDSIGAAILAASAESGADMLVIGAYSHSRWREMIIGGVTRHAVHHAAIPVLMSH